MFIYSSVSEIVLLKLWEFGELQDDGRRLKLKVLIPARHSD